VALSLKRERSRIPRTAAQFSAEIRGGQGLQMPDWLDIETVFPMSDFDSALLMKTKAEILHRAGAIDGGLKNLVVSRAIELIHKRTTFASADEAPP
jgi:hypothetical protein